jgi:hypothetical protein
MTFTTPPSARPYSAGYPPDFTSTSSTNSTLIALPWMPLMTFVVLMPSVIHWFSADVAP